MSTWDRANRRGSTSAGLASETQISDHTFSVSPANNTSSESLRGIVVRPRAEMPVNEESGLTRSEQYRKAMRASISSNKEILRELSRY